MIRSENLGPNHLDACDNLNLGRKSTPVEEPNYHLSIEPVRCPDKTKEKFILFYTPIAANATRVRDGATPTRSRTYNWPELSVFP